MLQPSHRQFQFQSPAEQTVSPAPRFSSLSPRIWAFGPSALPCAGAAPPQRPALASHLAQSSPALCPANSVYPPQCLPPTCCLAPPTTDRCSSLRPPRPAPTPAFPLKSPVRAGLVPPNNRPGLPPAPVPPRANKQFQPPPASFPRQTVPTPNPRCPHFFIATQIRRAAPSAAGELGRTRRINPISDSYTKPGVQSTGDRGPTGAHSQYNFSPLSWDLQQVEYCRSTRRHLDSRPPPNTGSRGAASTRRRRCPAYRLYHSQMPAISFNVSTSRIPIRRYPSSTRPCRLKSRKMALTVSRYVPSRSART